MDKKREHGAIMVEAAIYFPITIAVVMAILYLGLYKMQESYFFFQVERAAAELSKEVAYPGYDSFEGKSPLESSKVDFSWEEGPSAGQVSQYYDAYNGKLSKLYRWGLDTDHSLRAQKYQEALSKNSAIFSMGSTEAYVRINNGFMSKSVQAELRYVIPTPGILRYIGVKDSITLYAGAYQPVQNTTDFVRNTDLACDMTEFLLKKLGLDGKAGEFLEKFNKIKEMVF